MTTSQQSDREFDDSNRYGLTLIFTLTLFAAVVVGFAVQAFRQAETGSYWNEYVLGLGGVILGAAIGFYHYRPIWGVLGGGLAGGLLAFVGPQVLSADVFVQHWLFTTILAAAAATWLWRSRDALR